MQESSFVTTEASEKILFFEKTKEKVQYSVCAHVISPHMYTGEE